MAGRLSAEGLRNQAEREGTGDSRTERLPLLLELLALVGDLNQLLELLKLCREPVKQLLQVHRLLLLEELHLLQLLRHDLQQLRDLVQHGGRHRADSVRPRAVAAAGERIRQGCAYGCCGNPCMPNP